MIILVYFTRVTGNMFTEQISTQVSGLKLKVTVPGRSI